MSVVALQTRTPICMRSAGFARAIKDQLLECGTKANLLCLCGDAGAASAASKDDCFFHLSESNIGVCFHVVGGEGGGRMWVCKEVGVGKEIGVREACIVALHRKVAPILCR